MALTDEDMTKIEDESKSIIIHLERIKKLAEGKENYIAIFASYRINDIKSLVEFIKFLANKRRGEVDG